MIKPVLTTESMLFVSCFIKIFKLKTRFCCLQDIVYKVNKKELLLSKTNKSYLFLDFTP